MEAVLGANPFSNTDAAEADSLDAWLGALDRLAARGELAPSLVAPPKAEPEPTPAPVEPTEAPEPDPELGGLVRLVGEEARRQLTALTARLEDWDRFGLSRSALIQSFPIFYALYRLYFRVRSEGHAAIPREGPVVLAANHGGLLPFDGAMAILDVLLHTDPPRLPRAIVERWAGRLPFVNVFFARVGQVVGTHENFARLLADEEAVLVFPEGVEGIRKPVTQRYRLQTFRTGFVRAALAAGAPIVPVAIVGSEDQAPILWDVKPLARLLGLPVAPITPTFPWLGPLGLLPYPVRYRIAYGEPIDVARHADPAAAEDPLLANGLAREVRRAVQRLLDRNR
jgi:1-acyl-sn-glycerol-3-phosphate acyltransferase